MRVKKVTGILLFCCFNQDIASDIIRLRLRRPIPEEIRRIYHLRIFSEVCTDIPDCCIPNIPTGHIPAEHVQDR